MARKNHGRVTLSDIAEACGLAVSTVSRALTEPGRVAPATQERVERTAAELGYVRSRSSGRDGGRPSIALLLPNIENPYVLDLIRGVAAQSQASGFELIVASFSESVQVEVDYLQSLADRVAGIVLQSPRGPDALVAAAARRAPIVVINRAVPAVPAVVVDTSEGMRAAVDHLVSNGHRTLAYVRGPATSWSDRQRFDAIRSACRTHGVELTPTGPFFATLTNGRAAADAVLATHATSAIFFNDVLAIGALGRFRDLGVRVPDDISIIGCDDIFGASFSEPPLSTVTVPGEAIGRVATDMLITTLTATVPVKNIQRFTPHLTIRESTGPAPAA